MRTLVCTCGKMAKTSGTNSGEQMKETGFRVVMSASGALIWLCSECYKIAHEAALMIRRITQDEYVFILNLLKE